MQQSKNSLAYFALKSLNALVKTLETKAFAECDMSLCAPFLAFDPVCQFLISTIIIPYVCGRFSFNCLVLEVSLLFLYYTDVPKFDIFSASGRSPIFHFPIFLL